MRDPLGPICDACMHRPRICEISSSIGLMFSTCGPCIDHNAEPASHVDRLLAAHRGRVSEVPEDVRTSITVYHDRRYLSLEDYKEALEQRLMLMRQQQADPDPDRALLSQMAAVLAGAAPHRDPRALPQPTLARADRPAWLRGVWGGLYVLGMAGGIGLVPALILLT